VHRRRIIEQERLTWNEFLSAAAIVSTENAVGKVLASTRYVHRSVLTRFSLKCDEIDHSWISLTDDAPMWNVLRINSSKRVLALLSYPGFETIAHPQLACSLSVDLVKQQTVATDFSARVNPPVLHRKELFLHPAHPQYELFQTLTVAEEQAGLLSDSRSIGYTRQWQRRLQAYNRSIVGHLLQGVASDAN
jgi:DNA phosphorothioation-associated putative methyltransferase